ncbi:putative inactive purple acid phosphatase 29 isoform X2 [Silene latifolia]|uniref:putative inactive purple acid phosphatase 29 isoform X2 n=1 Tax=Silene latifolia TaxID=37657 RepID=UPI003D77A4BE
MLEAIKPLQHSILAQMMELRSSFKVLYLVAIIYTSIGGLNCQISTALRFNKHGEFKILQVADMHYANGQKTPCENVLPTQIKGCSDLNTTVFIKRMIKAENPDFIVFTGDNIFGSDATDAGKSMDAAFAPAVESHIPWAAVLGNHDQESTLSREGVMKYIVRMNNTLSKLNPAGVLKIAGFGNYNLEVAGVHGSPFQNNSILNLYFLDSGDYSKVPFISGYDWIKSSQKSWFLRTSTALKSSYNAPGLVYFHIPLPEFARFSKSKITGVKQEGISSPSINSGFFNSLVKAGDVRAVFVGHDHINDFCGLRKHIHLCYAGGFGYHAYGKAGWSRRARVVSVKLEKVAKGVWGPVKSIQTWKRLDDAHLTTIDAQVLWSKRTAGPIESLTQPNSPV